jgi:BirA family biotin operon repressor/biotin-[acetyl-CoA-carboxylase] ligase
MNTALVKWHAEAVWEAIEPLLTGFSVEVLPSVDSTNSELMRRARAGQFAPVLLVAEHQSAGRGRMGRTWESDCSPLGSQGLASLTFSLGLPLAPEDWSGLSLAVGLSVAQSLHPSLQLKWPNDVLLQGRKLAGILIETASIGDVRYAVVGVGLNILLPDAQDLSTPPAALHEVLPGIDAPAALALVAQPLVQTLLRFEQHGFAALRPEFHVRDALYGQEVQCSDNHVGMARGVDASGALLVQTANGLQKITSAQVSVRATVRPPIR